MTAYLDTHILLWLLQSETRNISETALEVIDTADLLVSPMVLLETALLQEIGRTLVSPQEIELRMQTELNIGTCDLPFSRVIEAAFYESWTRDPFDRILVAQARARNSSPLITADTRIRNHYAHVLW